MEALAAEKNNSLFFIDTRQDWDHYAGHIKNALSFSMEPNWLAGPLNKTVVEFKDYKYI